MRNKKKGAKKQRKNLKNSKKQQNLRKDGKTV